MPTNNIISPWVRNKKRIDIVASTQIILFNPTKLNEQSSLKTFSIQNSGYLPIRVTEIKTVGSFYIVHNSLGSIPPNGVIDFNIMFRPRYLGKHFGAVYVVFGDNNADAFIELEGTCNE